jgi:hypothetical protein
MPWPFRTLATVLFLDEADGSNFWGGLPARQVADAEAGDSALALPSDVGDVQNVLPLDQADEARATSTGPCPPKCSLVASMKASAR